MYEDIFLPADRFKGLEQVDISQRLLYPIYDTRFATPVIWAEEFLEPRLATATLAGYLGLREGDPVIYVERTAYTYEDLPVEFRCSFGRGDRFRYHIELR
jgi:GntR family transcriptional regulator